jgi:hypothetical protein
MKIWSVTVWVLTLCHLVVNSILEEHVQDEGNMFQLKSLYQEWLPCKDTFAFMHLLHDVHKMNTYRTYHVCLSFHPSFCLSAWFILRTSGQILMEFGMDFGGCCIIVMFNSLQSLIPTWWTNELVRWDWYWCHLVWCMYDMAYFLMSAWGIQVAKLPKMHVEILVYSGMDYAFPVLFDFIVVRIWYGWKLQTCIKVYCVY